jgi:putative sugar O-methyltransferase
VIYFPKIDQSEITTSLGNTKLFLEENKKKRKISLFDQKILSEIIEYYNLYSNPNYFGGTWEWIDKTKRNDLYKTIKKDNLKKINTAFSNFFRNYLSFGLISSHWEKRKDIGWKRKLHSDIYKNLSSWEEFTKKSNHDYKLLHSNTDVGNPYGLSFKKKIILFDTPRHDYYADKIANLIKKSKNIPIILEIGGGYGGLAAQLLKRKLKFKYINIDIFNTLPVAYYYLKKNFKIDIKIKKSIKNDDINNNNFIFIPYFGQSYWSSNKEISLVFNSNSFSEMGKKTLYKYFNCINNKIKPLYLLHQNTNITSFKKLKKYQEIPSTKFPIDYNNYKMINSSISLFQGGSGRYREYLFKRKS